jgi:hypothetical protein
MSAADKVSYVYTMNRAHLIAGMAVVTLGVIYGGYVSYEGYCSVGTGLHALAAGYASVLTNLTNVCALVVVAALNDNGGGVVYEMYYIVGTGPCTKTATDATARVYLGNSLFLVDADSISGTNGNAITVSKAGKGTNSVARKAHICRLTALGTVIIILALLGRAGAVTSNVRNLFDNVGCHKAHYLRYLPCSSVTAGNTKRGVVGLALAKRLCISVAAGKAASAAVGTGKTVANETYTLILFNLEENRGNSKNNGTHRGYCQKNQNRNKYFHF